MPLGGILCVGAERATFFTTPLLMILCWYLLFEVKLLLPFSIIASLLVNFVSAMYIFKSIVSSFIGNIYININHEDYLHLVKHHLDTNMSKLYHCCLE